jgi:hypothetical protein
MIYRSFIFPVTSRQNLFITTSHSILNFHCSRLLLETCVKKIVCLFQTHGSSSIPIKMLPAIISLSLRVLQSNRLDRRRVRQVSVVSAHESFMSMQQGKKYHVHFASTLEPKSNPRRVRIYGKSKFCICNIFVDNMYDYCNC